MVCIRLKIPENEIQPTNQSGEIVLSKVVIPETVVVHDGPPSDSSNCELLCAVCRLY